jgi:site-specific DNA recombinase
MDSKRAVVAYCRVSTLEQKRRGHGIEIQIRDVILFAERQGFFVDRFYKDEAQSGIAEHRRALRRLLRDCRHGEIEALILPSLDRLSRDVRLAENLFYEFEQTGVRVLIVDMPTYDSKDRKDVLIRQIREAIAEENRKDIIERLWKGRQERVRRGLPPGGNVAYGYRRTRHGVVIDLSEAAIVRTIFEAFESGQGRTRIAVELNEKGLTRRNGKPWSQRQVAAVLSRRESYGSGGLRYGVVVGRNRALRLLFTSKAECRGRDLAGERHSSDS